MAKKLSTGNTVHIKNRLYGVIDAKGRMVTMWLSATERVPAVYFTRADARGSAEEGERVIRLADVSGTVV